MKTVQVVMALVTVAGLSALWVARSRTGISEVPRATQPRGPRSEPAPELILPQAPVGVPTSGASLVHPVEKATPTPGSETPVDPSAELRKRIADLKRTSRDPGETQREAIRATADYLSIRPASIPAFEEAARQSVLERDLAWATLKADLATLAEKDPSPAEGSSTRRLAEARYAVARRKSLDRLQPFLRDGPHAQEFQWGFDAWAAAVSAQAEQVYSVSAGK